MTLQRIVARVPEGLSIGVQGSTNAADVNVPGASNFLTSPDGKLLVAPSPTSVDVYDGLSLQKVISIPESAVVLTAISPSAKYLVTCSKPIKDASGQPGKNLKVWEIASGNLVQSMPQKQVHKDHWPAIHWAGDESALAHMVTNTVHIYSKSEGFENYRKVTIKGAAGLALSPATSGPALHQLAVFMPEAKGSPASAGIFDWSGSGPTEPQALVRKSFFRTQGAQLMWNKTASAVLVYAYSDYDATNQSYYGEQKLHYLPSDPAKFDKACTVDLKDGPVHDVQWSPSGEHFAVVAGFIPSKVMLFDANCKPVYDFGSGPYNTVRWNPFGRFLAVAGFGNLPGDIIFYDKKVSGACKQMGAVRSPAVTAAWSPDGRHLLTATVAPRMRVDNTYKVFTYFGKEVVTQPFPTLFEAAWVPAAPGTYQDRPQSPERLTAIAGGSPSAAATLAPKAAGYIPPHLRSAAAAEVASGGGAPRPQFSLAFDASDKPGKVPSGATSARPVSSKPQPPGAESLAPTSKAAMKNAKKRANKKKGPDDDKDKEDELIQTASGLTLQGEEQNSTEENGADDVAKRIRALQKKLRQVAELKDKIKEGKSATPEQQMKLDGEAELKAELTRLGA